MVGFFRETSGDKSMIRLIAFIGCVLGGIIVVTGLGLITLVVVSKSFDALGSLIGLEAIGTGLFGGGEFAKSLQKKWESNG